MKYANRNWDCSLRSLQKQLVIIFLGAVMVAVGAFYKSKPRFHRYDQLVRLLDDSTQVCKEIDMLIFTDSMWPDAQYPRLVATGRNCSVTITNPTDEQTSWILKRCGSYGISFKVELLSPSYDFLNPTPRKYVIDLVANGKKTSDFIKPFPRFYHNVACPSAKTRH